MLLNSKGWIMSVINAEYRHLLKEAFIEPVRTVTVIDDEYPTYTKLVTDASSYNSSILEKVKKTYAYCRSQMRKWRVDIFDGQSDDEDVIRSLFQSDLLILDYHLDGEQYGLCQKAIDIIRGLATEEHFNLVLVHTKGYDGKLSKVFEDVVFGLGLPIEELLHSKSFATDDEIDELLEDLELEVSDLEGMIDTLSLLEVIKRDIDYNSTLFTELRVKYDGASDIYCSFESFVNWVIRKKLQKKNSHGECIKDISFGFEEEKFWIQGKNIFLAFSKKSEEIQYVDDLLDSLEFSQIHPHELLVAHMRHELDKNGFAFAREISMNKALQTAWTRKLKSDSEGALSSIVQAHWEELFSCVTSPLEKVLTSVQKVNPPILDQFINSDFDEVDLLLQYNSYQCTKKVDDSTLSIGKVIYLSGNYYLCITPACDLVTGRSKSNSWKERLNGYIPVKMIKLSELEIDSKNKIKKYVNGATKGDFLYIKIDEKIKVFSFYPNGDSSKAPDWEEFFIYGVDKLKGKTLKLNQLVGEKINTKHPFLNIIEKEE